jgi:hypothetical protein
VEGLRNKFAAYWWAEPGLISRLGGLIRPSLSRGCELTSRPFFV